MNVSDQDRLNALTSLYATERADLASIGNQCLAIIGVGLTYIVAIIIGLFSSTSTKGNYIFWLASPIPLLTVLAFYTIFVSLAMARTKSCSVLHEEITSEIGITPNAIGVAVSNRILDFKEAPLRYKALILTSYVPVILSILALIAYVVVRAILQHINMWIIISSIIIYAILLAPSTVTWIKKLEA
jgi:hypothetical protein